MWFLTFAYRQNVSRVHNISTFNILQILFNAHLRSSYWFCCIAVLYNLVMKLSFWFGTKNKMCYNLEAPQVQKWHHVCTLYSQQECTNKRFQWKCMHQSYYIYEKITWHFHCLHWWVLHKQHFPNRHSMAAAWLIYQCWCEPQVLPSLSAMDQLLCISWPSCQAPEHVLSQGIQRTPG